MHSLRMFLRKDQTLSIIAVQSPVSEDSLFSKDKADSIDSNLNLKSRIDVLMYVVGDAYFQ